MRDRDLRLSAFSLLSAVALSSSACGESDDGHALERLVEHPVPGCEHIDHSCCDVRRADCQERLLSLAACLRGEEGGELPPISIVSPAQYENYLRMVYAENPLPEPNHYERALDLLGLVEPGAFDPDALIGKRVENVGGFYRYVTRDIVLVDREQASGADEACYSLLHEFIHFLQDRQVDLVQFSEQYEMSDDSFLAARSLIEGEAHVHTTRYVVSLFGLELDRVDWIGHFDNAIAQRERWLFQQRSPYAASSSVFPYYWGALLVHRAWLAGGQTAITDLFAAPPTTTHQVMASRNAPAPPPPEVSLPPSVPAQPGWELWSEETLGAWGVYVRVMLPRGSAANEKALAWQADRLAIYAKTDALATPRTIAVWRIQFADSRVAEEVHALLATPDVFASLEDGMLTLAASDEPNFEWALGE
ncbi:MAG TPA: hypothetical protein VIM73_08220 [Polyangiaceae bacterium]